LALSRDQKINTDIYTALLSSAEQYKVAKAGTIGNVRVVDAAAASPIPSKPNRSVLLAVSVLAGAIAALVAAMVRRTLQPYFLSADDVEKRTALPVYGTIPESKLQSSLFLGRRHVEKKSRLLQVLAPTDLAIESLRSLQLAMQFAMSGTENKNILITGPTSSLGKSFISANLAAVLGGTGKRVLLVDTDMRKPRLHQYFSLKLSPGLADLLAARSPFSEILNIGVVPNVDVISAGTKPPNPSELLVNGRIEKLLEWAQDKYDTVVLDSPPLLPVGDAVIVAKSVGAVFLVLRFEQSTPAEALEAMRRLDNVGISPKGVIFNGLRLDRLRYGYQYRGYYGYA
jgi:tyrosine-protein kinase Etk/Wzc